MERLHVCYVENGYPCRHSGGGAGTYVQLIGKELVLRGHKVSVIAGQCPECPSHELDDGVNVYRPKRSSLHWWFSRLTGLEGVSLSFRYLEHGRQLYRFIEKLHKKNPIDIAEFSEGGDFWHMFNPKFPYISHLHGSRYTVLYASGRKIRRTDWYHRRLELLFIDQGIHVMSPSNALLNLVEKEMKHKLKSSTVMPCPLDPRLENLRSKVKSDNRHKTVFFAARNDPVKGGQILLEAVPLIQRKVPDIKFQFFGFKPKPDMVIPEGVSCNDFLPKEKLLEPYQEADICVIPSYWDNSPNTVYEAMAAGKAVVASRVGGIPELVKDGETGILVDPGNSKHLADAIIDLLLDRKKRISMGEKASERILQLASLSDNVDRRLALYQKIITKHK